MRVWLLALVWAGLTLVLLSRSWMIQWLSYTPSTEALNLSRLSIPVEPALRVVALGSSKTMMALPFDHDFPPSRDAEGVPIRFQRFSVSRPDFNDLAPVLGALLEHPPEMLLLESDLLLYDRQGRDGRDLLADYRDGMQLLVKRVRAAWQRVLPGASENLGAESWPTQSYCQASRAPGQLASYAQYARSWTVTTTQQRQAYLKSLRLLQGQGTVIVLLDLPRAPHASQLVASDLAHQVSELRSRLQVEEGLLFWSPGEVADELYCDQGHFTRAGRQFYTAWLRQQLAEWRPSKVQP